MAIILKFAQSAEDKEKVFRLRHQVFVEQESRFDHREPLIYDRFDAYSETSLVLATDNGVPVGTVRLTLDSPAGMPANDYYDFRPFIKSREGAFVSIGWLCISRTHRRHRGLLMGLFKLCTYEARHRGARHVIAPLHPGIFSVLQAIGAVAVDREFTAPDLNVPMVPIHVDLDRFPQGAREIMSDPLNRIFDESRERRIYHKNEPIVHHGEYGSEAFLIMRGSARVVLPDKSQPGGETESDPDAIDDRTVLIGPGQIFGELSLLDGGHRTATVVAHSKELDVMVWSREEFLNQIRCDAEKAFETCRILGARLRGQISGMPAMPRKKLVARVLLVASGTDCQPVQIKWLAAQCGYKAAELVEAVSDWVDADWIAPGSDNDICLINPLALKAMITEQL